MSKYILFDLETTGLDTTQAEVIEVAYMTFDSSTIVESLFKSSDPIPYEVSGITNIDNSDVEECNLFMHSEIYYQLQSFASAGYIAVCHNTLFDCEVLKFQGINFRESICTYTLAKSMYKHLANHKLGTLRAYYGIPHSGDAHRAGYNVQILSQVFDHMRDCHFNSLDEMVETTRKIQDSDLKIWQFGKYKGEFIDFNKHQSYIQWVIDGTFIDNRLREYLKSLLI